MHFFFQVQYQSDQFLGKNKHYVVAEHQNLLMVGVVPLSKGAVSSRLVSEFSK